MSSKESVIYNPGLIRDDTPGCSNSSIMLTTTAPGDKSNMVVTTSHPGTWTRTIDVYVPANYVRGTRRRSSCSATAARPPTRTWSRSSTI